MKNFIISCLYVNIFCVKLNDFALNYKHEQSIAYCARQKEATARLLHEGKRFWNKTKNNINFKVALLDIEEKIGEKIVKSFSKKFIKLIHFFSTGIEYSNYNLYEFGNVQIYAKIAYQFYDTMQIISQYIDFSNPLYKGIISKLVKDLALRIEPYNEMFIELPGLMEKKIHNVIKKAIYISKSISKLKLDKIDLKSIDSDEILKVKEQIKAVIKNRNNKRYKKVIYDSTRCLKHRIHSSLIFKIGYDVKYCNKDWVNCDILINSPVQQNNNTLIL